MDSLINKKTNSFLQMAFALFEVGSLKDKKLTLVLDWENVRHDKENKKLHRHSTLTMLTTVILRIHQMIS